jgi:predicted DNA binding CopG/RHH family protein
MKKKIKLDAYEREIEENIPKFKPAKNQEKLRKDLIEAAKNHVAERERKTKSVTIRLQEADIEAMRKKANKIGIPYQTYINIVIHRDAVTP